MPAESKADAPATQLRAMVPAVADAPKGEVTLGENAGAFGPWRAHHLVNEIARTIAGDVIAAMCKVPGPRVLVVDERSLLLGSWTSHRVQASLERLESGLTTLKARLDDEKGRLDEALTELENVETNADVRRNAGDTAPSAVSLGGAARSLGAAVDLLGLLRTDYSVTATSVTATASELAVLTASHLVGKAVVETDGLTTMRESPSENLVKNVLVLRDDALDVLTSLRARLAPIEAELASGTARVAALEQTWATAIAENKDEERVQLLRVAVESVAQRMSQLTRAAGPATVEVAYTQQVIADADANLQSLLQAPDGGEPPLLTAVRRERLGVPVSGEDSSVERFTHVLYVSLDALAADAVTRRSILGTSGRIRFLSAGNASWLLLDTSTGTIANGGQVNLADALTFRVESPDAQYTSGEQWQPRNDEDPLTKLEASAKGLVFFLVLALGVLAVFGFIAVIRMALG